MSDQQFCSTHEAAKLLGVSVKTVQLWTESGELRAWKTPLTRGRPKLFTILVVDDDPDTHRLYELMIPHWGLAARVTTAKDGFEGLIRIGAEQPDLLITDLRMPGMDGLAMIGKLPPDILLFAKPIPFEQLRPAIEQCISEDAAAG